MSTMWTIGDDGLKISLTPIFSLSLTSILSNSLSQIGFGFWFCFDFFFGGYRCICRFMVVAMGDYCGGGGDGFTMGLRRWLGSVRVGGGGAFGFWFWVFFGCLVIFSLGVW